MAAPRQPPLAKFRKQCREIGCSFFVRRERQRLLDGVGSPALFIWLDRDLKVRRRTGLPDQRSHASVRRSHPRVAAVVVRHEHAQLEPVDRSVWVVRHWLRLGAHPRPALARCVGGTPDRAHSEATRGERFGHRLSAFPDQVLTAEGGAEGIRTPDLLVAKASSAHPVTSARTECMSELVRLIGGTPGAREALPTRGQ